MNPYEANAVYETRGLYLRLVTMEDANDLLLCYSDQEAVAKMNADSCTSNFYYTTLKQMQNCITYWLSEYEQKRYVRFSVIPKEYERAVGTVEMFGCDFPDVGRAGVLRIDLAAEYENSDIISELTALSIGSFIPDFNADTIFIKAGHTPERAKVLKDYGFIPTEEFRPGLGYYSYKHKKIAYCGLACCFCSKNKSCQGCHEGGCDIHSWCKNYNCCRGKGLAGCWECDEFPCSGGMLDKLRIRAFAGFARKYGTDELVRCLMNNKVRGIVYHYEGQLIGDYDKCQSEAEVYQMIRDVPFSCHDCV